MGLRLVKHVLAERKDPREVVINAFLAADQRRFRAKVVQVWKYGGICAPGLVKPVGNGAEVWYTISSFAPGGAEMVWRGRGGGV